MVNERGVERGYLWTFVLTLGRKDLSLCLGGFVLRGPRQNQKKNKYSLYFIKIYALEKNDLEYIFIF